VTFEEEGGIGTKGVRRMGGMKKYMDNELKAIGKELKRKGEETEERRKQERVWVGGKIENTRRKNK